MLALLPVFGLFGCGGGKKYTSDDVVLINTAYYGTEMNPVYSFALKKEKDGWLFSADCLVGRQKDHYTSFGSFPITAEDAEAFLHIICEDGEIEKLYKHRDPIRIFRSSDAPARSSGMTFSDGNTIEKETMLGDRRLTISMRLPTGIMRRLKVQQTLRQIQQRTEYHHIKARKAKNKPTLSEKGGKLWPINVRSVVRTSI